MHINLDRPMQADLPAWGTAGVFSRSMKKEQRSTMGTHNRLTKWLFVMLAMVGPTLAHDGSAAVKAKSATPAQNGPARMVPQYGAALAANRVAEWAALDLGCLTLRRQRGRSEQTDRTCWDETLKVHRELVQDQPETGIFEAVGRGVGFGLLS